MAHLMESVEESFKRFDHDWPGFARTRVVDEMRAKEFRRLDESGQVYLDYTGGSLYSESQVRRHLELLLQQVLGNPHSASPASRRSTELVEGARARVLRFFQASPDEYDVVFTTNATHALKLVGEAYPFARDGRFTLTFDNHNSVNGIREFARARGAQIEYVPVRLPDMRSLDADVERALDATSPDGAGRLFAFPAQSNFSGVQHPLEWIDAAHERRWDVLLDAAAFAPTNRLTLDRWHPDFVTVSFYKMFGYPTGIGALVARREALGRLRRPWFSGGTITVASVSADRYFLEVGAAAFEDGTLDYANLPAVTVGLDLLDRLGMELIHERIACLTGWLLGRLSALRHTTGHPLVTLYGPDEVTRRGGTVALNFRGPDGAIVDHARIERLAGERGLSVRTGCFCNPGAGEIALGLSREDMTKCLVAVDHHLARDEFRRCVDPKSSGAVRVSLGFASNFADVYAFVQFAREFLQ